MKTIELQEIQPISIPSVDYFSWRTRGHCPRRLRLFHDGDDPQILATFTCKQYPEMLLHIACPDLSIGIGGRIAKSDPIVAFFAFANDRDVISRYSIYDLYNNRYLFPPDDGDVIKLIKDWKKKYGRPPMPCSSRRLNSVYKMGANLWYDDRERYLLRLEDAIHRKPPTGCMVCGDDLRTSSWNRRLPKCMYDPSSPRPPDVHKTWPWARRSHRRADNFFGNRNLKFLPLANPVDTSVSVDNNILLA